MADEFQTGACNAAWWNVEAALDTKVSSSSISVTSVNLQDLHQPPPPAVPTAGYLLDSSAAAFGLPSPSPSLDWTHNFQGGHDHDAGSGGSNFHSMLQDDHMNSIRPYGGLMQTNQIHQATIQESNATGLLRDVSHAFLVDQQHLAAGGTGNSEAAEGAATTTFFQGLLEPVDLPSAYAQDVDCRRTSAGNENTITTSQPPSQYHWSNFQQQLRFSNTSQPSQLFNTQIGDNARGGFFGSSVNPNPHYYAAQPIAGKPIPNNLAPTKVKSGGATRENVGIRTSKKSSSEPSFKKPRMEVPSPLPTFKVRKEKLGDRITALQQLVSPFGKTDTASVLYEAIEYIKFLHDQVNVLSTPYLKNGHPMQHQQKFDKANEIEGMKKDLRSRGLCLVPISSTFAVANEPTDFWTPTFGGTFR